MTGSPTREALVEALRAIVGPTQLLTDPDVRASYETDWTGRFHGEATCVARPGTTAEVAAVLRVCAQHAVGVVTQGGNTGLVGAGVPRGNSHGGEVLLSLARLDHIGPVDADRGEVTVGAGATLAAVRDAVAGHGWDVGIDLASRDRATIGGMVATNAGGANFLRYGSMADQVLGIEAALADGAVIGRVPALRKDNSGYRLAGLLAGSEGTLAVITQVQLALVPLIIERCVALLGLDDLPTALRLLGRLRRGLPSLLAAEVCFADGIDLVCSHAELPWPIPRAPVVLLLECGDASRSAALTLDELGAILGTAPEVRASAVATDPTGRHNLWQYRDRHAEAVNSLGIPHKLDVTIPFDRLATFPDQVRATIRAVTPDARVVLFGHLGDGNLHVNIIGPGPDDGTVDEAVLHLVAELGGSISAEHGIGVAKRAFLPLVRTPAELDTMRALKTALDPSWHLNPGVLLTPPD